MAASELDDGEQGKWSKIPKEILSYLIEVEQHFKSLDDPEDQQLLVANVLEELSGKELVVVSDPVGSRLLETLLHGVTAESLARILQALANVERLYQASTSGPGCHVLEMLLKRLLDCLLGPGQEHQEQLEKVLEDMVVLVAADLYDYILDRNATYVARRLLCVAAGRDVLPVVRKGDRESAGTKVLATKGKRSGLAAKVHSGATSKSTEGMALYPDLVAKFVAALQRSEFDSETLRGLAGSPFSGPFLQALLNACKSDGFTLEALIPRLLGASVEVKGTVSGKVALNTVEASSVQSMMEETSSSHLVEAIFTHAPEELQRQLCQKCLVGKLSQLAFHPMANFVVQAALASAEHPKLIMDFLSELEPELGRLLQRRKGGVVAALTAACGRIPKTRSQVCTALAGACAVLDDSCGVPSSSPQHKVAALICLDSHVKLDGEHDDKGPRMSPVGCAILATVLQYPQEDCKVFVTSLLGLQPKQLKQIALDRGGCRVLEAFVEGDAPMPQKQRLMRSLRGSYGQMAVRPSGSFFVEKCYNWADVDVKEDIVSELLSVETQLHVLNWGPGLVQLCGLEVYKHGRQQWLSRAQRMAKTVSQFTQLFGSDFASGANAIQVVDHDGSRKRTQTPQAEHGEDDGGKAHKKKRKKGVAAAAVVDAVAEQDTMEDDVEHDEQAKDVEHDRSAKSQQDLATGKAGRKHSRKKAKLEAVGRAGGGETADESRSKTLRVKGSSRVSAEETSNVASADVGAVDAEQARAARNKKSKSGKLQHAFGSMAGVDSEVAEGAVQRKKDEAVLKGSEPVVEGGIKSGKKAGKRKKGKEV